MTRALVLGMTVRESVDNGLGPCDRSWLVLMVLQTCFRVLGHFVRGPVCLLDSVVLAGRNHWLAALLAVQRSISPFFHHLFVKLRFANMLWQA